MFYKTAYGSYIERSSVESSFLISTGEFASENPGNFMRYLNSIWGKYIIEACNPTIEELIINNQEVSAIKKYKEDNKCSLTEAREAVKILAQVYGVNP